MENLIECGSLTAQFINDPQAWIIYAAGQNEKVADIRSNDWANESVDFSSKAAGQLILDTMIELRTAFLGADAEMVKSDQGVTKDVPPPTAENMHPEPDLQPPDKAGSNDAEEALELIKMIVDDVDTNHAGEPTKEHIAAINEAELLFKRAIDNMMDEAEEEASQGNDVTDKLAKIEALLKA